jgi:hypothetical protein
MPVKAGHKPLIGPLAVLLLAIGPALSASCSSGDDEIVNNPPSNQPEKDASSFGGTNGFGGVGGIGGSSGTGALGSGGTSGGGSGGTAGGGTCNPDFCPTNGVATPCCVVSGVGPCGFDYGMGCQGGEPRNDI